MSDINANIVVEPKEITISTTTNQLTVDASPINLNVFTGDSIAGGQPGEIQYNAGGVLGGVPTATYTNGNFALGNTNTVKLYGGANAYFLQTDGTGNITWAPGTINAPIGNKVPVGANKQIQITDGTGNFVSAPGFTFDNASNLFTAPGDAYIAGNTTVNNNLNITNNTTIGGNANITGNVGINGNANVIGNVSANYLLGNGAFITGVDATKISNGNTTLRAYSNLPNGNSIAFAFSSNGNANNVTVSTAGELTAEYINVKSGGSQFNGGVTFYATVSLLGPSPVNIGAGIITGNIQNGNSNILLYGAGNSLDSVRISSNNVSNGFVLAGNVATFIGNVVANKYIGNGYTLSNINPANIAGNVGNANFATYSGVVITNAQPNITSLGNLTGLTVNGNTKTYNLNVNNDIANSPTYQFVPNALNVVTQVGTKSYVAVTNLGNNSNQTNTAVIFGDNGLGSFNANNDSFANINGSNLFLATQVTSMTSGNTSNKAASGVLSWNVFGDNSDLANANTSTATGLELSGTTGLAVVRGAPIDNTGVLATFSYGGDTDPTNSVGLRMTRRRGNGAVRQTLQPNDYIANIEWRGAQLNGTTPAGNRFAKIGAKVDSSYTPNNSAQPVGLEFVVVNTTANITHNFYSNGVVNFANDLVVTSNIIANNSNITGVYYGNGSGLTSITGTNIAGQVPNATVAGTVYTNAQPNITSLGTLTGLTVNGTSNLGSNSNVKITGGSFGYVLATDGAGNLSWNTPGGGGGGTPGGSNTQIQFNASGIFGGTNAFRFDYATNNLILNGNLNFLNNRLIIGNTSNANSGASTVVVLGNNITGIGNGSIAIGSNISSNATYPGINSIVIGKNQSYTGNNCVVINATNTGLITNANGTYIAPVVNVSYPSAYIANGQPASGILIYGTDSSVTYTKSIMLENRTVANLPTAGPSTKGLKMFVSDCNSTSFYAIVGSGGSNYVPVFCDGTNWRIG